MDGTAAKAKRPKYDELALPPLLAKPHASGHYQCPETPNGTRCETRCKTRSAMRKHIRLHYKPVVCPFSKREDVPCTKRTAWQRDMQRHVEANHGRRSRVLCVACGTRVSRPDHLKRHAQVCRGWEGPEMSKAEEGEKGGATVRRLGRGGEAGGRTPPPTTRG